MALVKYDMIRVWIGPLPHLSLARVYAALTCSHANRDEAAYR